MIDRKDSSESSLRFILWQALSAYPTDELIKLVDDTDTIVRTMAAKQLHLRPGDEVFNKALDLCVSRTLVEREIGAFILGQLGTPALPYKNKSLPILVNLLRDKSHEVRSASVAAIGHLGSGAILDASLLVELSHLISDKHEDVRACCAFALGSFDKKSGAVTLLQSLREDNSLEVREWADISIEIIKER